MSIRKLIGMENGVQDFRLQVVPRSIVVPKNIKGFRLYLEKGMQIMGKFENDPNISLRDSFHRFRNPRPAQFRITNLLFSNYTWSLYAVNPETLQQNFIDSTSFNIERTIKLYQMELLDKQREIQTSFKEKNINRPMIIQLWNQAKKEMKTCRSILKCVFSNQDYQIQFQVQIKNILDDESQKIKIEKQQRKSFKRQKSDDFSSSNGSEVKGKNSQVKTKHEAQNAIQISFTPYKSGILKADEINTKQTIQLQTESYLPNEIKEKANNQGFNATVKIVNPSGEQIHLNQHDQSQQNGKKSYSDSSSGSNRQYPMKKFSLLSDIIEMSYEGSSSYGHPDHSSSNGFNHQTLRKDGTTMDYVIQNQMPQSGQGLNKFKTLPYQSHNHRHKLQVRDQFRRALTTQKHPSDLQSQLHEQSYISVNDKNKSAQNQMPAKSSGDPYGKWIIILAIIVIIGIISGSMSGEPNIGNKLKKKVKKIK